MDKKQAIITAAQVVLAENTDLASAHGELAGALNEAGLVVKQLSIVRFSGGAFVVHVNDDGEPISVEVKI